MNLSRVKSDFENDSFSNILDENDFKNINLKDNNFNLKPFNWDIKIGLKKRRNNQNETKKQKYSMEKVEFNEAIKEDIT